MAKTKKRKANFISSEGGQRFFNFAYSIGAAIVIWGALFKILHLPGGNLLLSIGMGTEVLMFILTAFDRPPREYKWEEVFPQLDKEKADNAEETTDAETDEPLSEPQPDDENATENHDQADSPVALHPGQTIIIGNHDGAHVTAGETLTAVPQPMPTTPGDVNAATLSYTEQLAAMTGEMAQLRASTQALNQVSETLLQAYRTITENSENITRSASGYVEQMGDLSRNIQGLNTIYEIQLKSISSQLDAIDRVNRGIKDIRDMYEKSSEQSARYCQETEKMARYMQQLNQVYEKMLTAMTINMYNPMAQVQNPPQAQTPNTESPQES